MKQSPSINQPALDTPKAVTVSVQLAALADPQRLRICRILEQQEISVGELARVVQLPQSTISRRLKALCEAGWLARRTVGVATYYRLSPDEFSEPTRALWASVRLAMPTTPARREDDRRLEAILADRRLDSRAFFGQVGGAWDDVRGELFGVGFTPIALLGLLDPDWTIADLGCGTGDASERLAPLVKRIIAVDQSEPMLAAARIRLSRFDNVEFRLGDLESPPIDDASVDAAVALLVVHHIERVDVALDQMNRVLKPGGVALLVDMFAHDRAEYRRTMGHKHLGFTSEHIAGLLGSAGFEKVRVIPLPSHPDAKGPGLFIATGRKPDIDR